MKRLHCCLAATAIKILDFKVDNMTKGPVMGRRSLLADQFPFLWHSVSSFDWGAATCSMELATLGAYDLILDPRAGSTSFHGPKDERQGRSPIYLPKKRLYCCLTAIETKIIDFKVDNSLLVD